MFYIGEENRIQLANNWRGCQNNHPWDNDIDRQYIQEWLFFQAFYYANIIFFPYINQGKDFVKCQSKMDIVFGFLGKNWIVKVYKVSYIHIACIKVRKNSTCETCWDRRETKVWYIIFTPDKKHVLSGFMLLYSR